MSVDSLCPADREIVQGALEVLLDHAMDHGLEITVEADFEEFARLRKLAKDGGCYPTVDPKMSSVGGDAFWLRVVNRDGALVAMMAERLFECDDFFDLLRSTRLWFDRGLRTVQEDYRVIDPDGLGPFGGLVGHGCALWVHPDFRRNGVSGFLTDVYRAVALLRHVDWHTCLVFERLKSHALKAYKYREIGLIVNGMFPLTMAPAEVYLCRAKRSEMVEHLRVPTLCLTRGEERARALASG